MKAGDKLKTIGDSWAAGYVDCIVTVFEVGIESVGVEWQNGSSGWYFYGNEYFTDVTVEEILKKYGEV
jgi:hypothetical protein